MYRRAHRSGAVLFQLAEDLVELLHPPDGRIGLDLQGEEVVLLEVACHLVAPGPLGVVPTLSQGLQGIIQPGRSRTHGSCPSSSRGVAATQGGTAALDGRPTGRTAQGGRPISRDHAFSRPAAGSAWAASWVGSDGTG